MRREAADPLEALPAALVAAIFARLDTRSLLQAGQVSRSWRRAADDLPALQARLRLVASRQPLARGDLRLLDPRLGAAAGAAVPRPPQHWPHRCYCAACLGGWGAGGVACMVGGCLAGPAGLEVALFVGGILTAVCAPGCIFGCEDVCRDCYSVRQQRAAARAEQQAAQVPARELARHREVELAAALRPADLTTGPGAAEARRRLKRLLQDEAARQESAVAGLVAAAAGDPARRPAAGRLLGLLGDAQLAEAASRLAPAEVNAVAAALIETAEVDGLQRLHPFVAWDLASITAADAGATGPLRTPATALDDEIVTRATKQPIRPDATHLEALLALRPGLETPLRPDSGCWLQAAPACAAQPPGSCPALAAQVQAALHWRLDAGQWDQLAPLRDVWPALNRNAAPGRPTADARLRAMLQDALQRRDAALLTRACLLLPLVFGGP